MREAYMLDMDPDPSRHLTIFRVEKTVPGGFTV